MARQLSKRERNLLVLLAIAVLVTAWYMVNGDDPSRIDGDASGATSAEAPGQAPEVLMALLTRDAEPYDPDGRDLFKFGVKPPSVEDLAAQRKRQEEQDARQEQLRQQADQRRAQAVKIQEPRDPGPRPPRATFRYLGYLGPKNERIAVFQQKEDLLLARVGELVEEDFRVLEIQYESVVLGFTDPRFENRTETLEMAGK